MKVICQCKKAWFSNFPISLVWGVQWMFQVLSSILPSYKNNSATYRTYHLWHQAKFQLPVEMEGVLKIGYPYLYHVVRIVTLSCMTTWSLHYHGKFGCFRHKLAHWLMLIPRCQFLICSLWKHSSNRSSFCSSQHAPPSEATPAPRSSYFGQVAQRKRKMDRTAWRECWASHTNHTSHGPLWLWHSTPTHFC